MKVVNLKTLINDMVWAIDLAAKTKKKTLILLPSHELLNRALARVSRKDVVIAENPGLLKRRLKESSRSMRRIIGE